MLRKMVEQKMLIGELTQGRELAAQLNQLDPVESPEACKALLEKIVSTFDKALSMLSLRGLKRCADQVETFHQTSAEHTNQALTTDQDFQKNVFKKRKTVPRWNEQKSVCNGDGEEESSKEEGHRWRKYGQKNILGAKFPRAYYRCTHQKTHGCLATKKVQRADNDSSIFQISYKGHHTCIHYSNSSSTDIQFPAVITNNVSNLNSSHSSNTVTAKTPSRNLQQGLKVETDYNMNRSKEKIFDFSSVYLTQIESAENVDSEFFSKLLKEDPDLVDRYSPVFLSPATTSGSDFVPFDWLLNDCGLNGGGLPCSDSDLTIADMNLTPTSAFESPFSDLDFCVDELSFDTTRFLSESLGYFS